MNPTIKTMTMLFASLLVGVLVPQIALSGMCANDFGICCDNSDQCWEATCLPYSGVCTGSDINGDVTHCNTDADCQPGDSCLSMGSCDGDPGFPCVDPGEQAGFCSISTIVCLTDAHCPPAEYCFIVGDFCEGPPCDPTTCEAAVTFEYSEPTTQADPVVEAPDGTTVSFEQVTSSGDTTVDKLLGTPVIPGDFSLLNDPTFVYDIGTTAGFVPPIEVCIPYDEPDPPIDETLIRLMHEEGGTFVDRTVLPVNTTDNIVCAEVSDLSDFVAAYESGCTDIDGDSFSTDGGVCGEIDCNDSNDRIFPTNANTYCDCEEPSPQGTVEICDDGIDNNCDGLVDNHCDGPCNWPGSCGAYAEASVYGSPEGKRSKVVNNLALLLIPVGAVILLRIVCRKK